MLIMLDLQPKLNGVTDSTVNADDNSILPQ